MRYFSIWPNIQMAESQWAECSNGRIQSKWTSTHARSFQSTCSGFGQFHRVIVWLRRDYRVVVNFPLFLKKNHEFCMNLNFSDIFRNIGRICSFRPFKSFGHLIIMPDFFRPLFLRPFVLGLQHVYRFRTFVHNWLNDCLQLS